MGEYYRHLTEKSQPETVRQQKAPPTLPYQANTFSLSLYEDWQDKTVYILAGPVTDGIQHNITINVEQETGVDALIDYVDWQTATLEQELKGCRMLLKEKIALDNGMPAYRAIFSWYPTEELRVYQEQIYVLHNNTGYKLTATFTKKTRKTLGPQVERMMLSFNPVS